MMGKNAITLKTNVVCLAASERATQPLHAYSPLESAILRQDSVASNLLVKEVCHFSFANTHSSFTFILWNRLLLDWELSFGMCRWQLHSPRPGFTVSLCCFGTRRSYERLYSLNVRTNRYSFLPVIVIHFNFMSQFYLGLEKAFLDACRQRVIKLVEKNDNIQLKQIALPNTQRPFFVSNSTVQTHGTSETISVPFSSEI